MSARMAARIESATVGPKKVPKELLIWSELAANEECLNSLPTRECAGVGDEQQ